MTLQMAKEKVYQLRLTEVERNLFEVAAKKSGAKLSEWLRDIANAACGYHQEIINPEPPVKKLPVGAIQKGKKVYTPNPRVKP